MAGRLGVSAQQVALWDWACEDRLLVQTNQGTTLLILAHLAGGVFTEV